MKTTRNSLALRNGALPELESLDPAERWELEEVLDDAQGRLRDYNDDELRRWVEEEGKTQAEIAKLVKKSPGRIGQRCSQLGLKSHSNRGRKRILRTKNSDDEEYVEAVVVEDDTRTRRNRLTPEPPAHYFPDVVAADAEENLRTQALHWFEQGAHIKELLDKKRPLEPRSDKDRKGIKREAALMERVARRLKETC